MRWKTNEDKICSLVFIKNHVLNELDLSISIQEAQHFGVDKTEGSIRMKFNNIASLCDEYGIKTSNRVGRLEHYSRQNHEEFISIKDFSFIEIMEELNKAKQAL
ncbi:hypothetical protein BK010_00365 [Tenericutes bacterium MO-XQ]|nr:hypothetical protein BK010_00365 [Tenericutes bacterium MO-XQ]